MDRGAWWATVRGAAESQTRLSDWAHRHVLPVFLLLGDSFCVLCNSLSLFDFSVYDFQYVPLEIDHYYVGRSSSYIPSKARGTDCVRGIIGWTDLCLYLSLGELSPSVRKQTSHVQIGSYPFFSSIFLLWFCYVNFVQVLLFLSPLLICEMMSTDTRIWIVSKTQFSAPFFSPLPKFQEERWDSGYITDMYNLALSHEIY